MESERNSSTTPLLSPQPRRPFFRKASSSSLTSNRSLASNQSDAVPVPTSQINNVPHDEQSPHENGEAKMKKSGSIMNLTSSTLSGIYAPTALNEPASSQQTPWGTGSQTPAIQEGIDRIEALSTPQRGLPNGNDLARRLNARTNQKREARPPIVRQPSTTRPSPARVLVRNLVLFFFGVVYGGIVSHLHSSKSMASVQIRKSDVYQSVEATLLYVSTWGLAGVFMGNLLPWIDEQSSRPGLNAAAKVSVGWSDAIRGVGSFVGVAFAIRRLPWETTLQLAITLSLANPLLWYLLDRTSSGLMLSTGVGLAGTAILLATNPLLIPAPTLPTGISITASIANTLKNNTSSLQKPLGGNTHYDVVATASWIASVLFCSCVCFGSIGRLLNSSNDVRRRSVDDTRSRSRGRG